MTKIILSICLLMTINSCGIQEDSKSQTKAHTYGNNYYYCPITEGLLAGYVAIANVTNGPESC